MWMQEARKASTGIGYLREASRITQTIAVVVIVTFTMSLLTPAVVAAQQINDDSTMAPAVVPTDEPALQTQPSDEAQFSRLLNRLERKLVQFESKLSRRLDAALEIEDLQKIQRRLTKLDAKLVKNFEKIRRFIKRKNLPAVILERHENTVTAYRGEIAALLATLNDSAQTADQATRLARVRTALEQLREKLNPRPNQPFDPDNPQYQTPKPNIREPAQSDADLQAWLYEVAPLQLAARDSVPGLFVKIANTAPLPEDLAPTEDAPLTDAIRALAQELQNQPVAIYNWVHDNIEYAPTFGSVQGAQLTLTSRRGNAFDTASLLIALLRAAGIHARYTYGTIQIPIDSAMNWVGGVDSADQAQELFSSGGVPTAAVVGGGQVTAIRLEHVWVEASTISPRVAPNIAKATAGYRWTRRINNIPTAKEWI